MVKERNGTIIYIDRPGCEVGNHQSEKEAFELYQEGKCDYVIHNDGTLKDLFEKFHTGYVAHILAVEYSAGDKLFVDLKVHFVLLSEYFIF